MGYYGYIYIIAILDKIKALQVRPKSAGLERLQGLENQPGEVRQKRKIEHARTLCEIVRKSEAKIRKSENGMFTFVVQVVHKIALR